MVEVEQTLLSRCKGKLRLEVSLISQPDNRKSMTALIYKIEPDRSQIARTHRLHMMITYTIRML